ncbi:hypothetical protein PPTG_22585 [Phytophthora nicotianae INRA-310]|uniref:Uncharacterized protein n=1 Tax=Phytophthora nicotianae (strain INRA-310) TaxID=761204 RepID=W2QE44_PHYN3|nr:hypothetical protein PPTG_22585 [Phytophthora nicotianae INRA-310]ETN11463.1 hypothetical protein PPTG_22585 [Phytophthora nicotianae INRA-310]
MSEDRIGRVSGSIPRRGQFPSCSGHEWMKRSK